MNLINLFVSFFKIGLFTIGGGLAMLPLLESEITNYGWLTESQFIDMIAISQSTPGPIGINMATFVGFNSYGILGSLVATIGMVSPSVIIICILARFFLHFNEHPIVKSAFYGLRPAVSGLIATAAYNIALVSIFNVELYSLTKNILDMMNMKAIILFVIILIMSNRYKKHPIFYIVVAGVIGVLVKGF